MVNNAKSLNNINGMKKTVLFCTVCALLLTSCGKNSSQYKALQAEKDSLALVAIRANVELEQIMQMLNEVEENFQSIKSAENYLTLQSSKTDDLTPSARDRIQNDMQFITDILEKNRQQIANLETKLKTSSVNSTQLSKTLDNLRRELEEKTNSLATLREELAKRDEQIAELTENVNLLTDDVRTLLEESSARQQVIDQQQAELNVAYYRFGTSRELKDAEVLVKGQVGSNFDRNAFIQIDDLHTQTLIQLYAKSGKLISKHPDGSYEFVKDAYGQVELRILNPESFWSLTKYLVIEVKV